MDKKLGVYICGGCSIGEGLDLEKLSLVATKEYKVPVCKTHSAMCGEEGVGLIKQDISAEGVNTVGIVACSGRVKFDVFDFGPSNIVERVNVREQVVWSHDWTKQVQVKTKDAEGKEEVKTETKPNEDDKNSPLTAFLFDLTGIMMILGVLFAYFRGRRQRFDEVPDLPRQDVLALGLIAAIVVVGFFLEGMRIAMTGFPEGSCYAFLGYGVGRLFFSGVSLTGAYGVMWYVHALLTGAFIAYMPFSRLLHIIISPFVLMGNAVSRHKK